jgi:hypothetical protein
MIKRFGLVAVAATLFGLAVPASAQLGAMADQKALVENQKVADILKGARADSEISEAVARRFGPLLFADGGLSLNERDLMQELLSAESTRTAIATPSGDAFDVPPISRQARAFLSLVRPPSLANLWLRGPAQMKQLVDITQLDPSSRSVITDYILRRLAVVWMESTVSDGYEPIRRDLSAAIRMLQQTDANTEREGRSLVFDATRELDRRNGDAVPNFLYDFLR